jgi:hypothetical protein
MHFFWVCSPEALATKTLLGQSVDHFDASGTGIQIKSQSTDQSGAFVSAVLAVISVKTNAVGQHYLLTNFFIFSQVLFVKQDVCNNKPIKSVKDKIACCKLGLRNASTIASF